jgi:hypothetical protein
LADAGETVERRQGVIMQMLTLIQIVGQAIALITAVVVLIGVVKDRNGK